LTVFVTIRYDIDPVTRLKL